MNFNLEAHNENKNEKEYLYSKYVWRGGVKWIYTYYLVNGRQVVEKEKVSAPKPKTTTTPKAEPSNIVKEEVPDKPSVVEEPVFNRDQPVPPVKGQLPEKPLPEEFYEPSPPPEPGEKPEFTFEKQKKVNKYEYVYGIKDLQVKNKQYQPSSIFVSKPIKVAGNAMQVSLHAVEEHPLFDEISGEADNRQTSIEYYIAYEHDPQVNDWHAILPEGEKTIKCELLMFDSARNAKLRFPASIRYEASVYKDGKVMDDKDWSFAENGRKVQLLVERDVSSVYTIDYTPNAEITDPWTLDLSEKGIKTQKVIETFAEGTNHNKTITLSNYPYVRKELIGSDSYEPIVVRLKDANIAAPNRKTLKEVLPYNENISQEAYTVNKTNYQNGMRPELKPYSLSAENRYGAFEYYHEGNKLYFTETFNKASIVDNLEVSHGNAMVEVEYEQIVSNFRIKAILRRNGISTNTLTPIVHEYALKFKVIK